MAEPDVIFKNGRYMNVDDGKMYIGVYRYPPSYQHYCSMYVFSEIL